MRARIADIIHHASKLSGFTVEQIKGPCRTKHLARTRQAICLVAREQRLKDGDSSIYAYSYPQIGMHLGRDHSTVIHACAKAELIVARDPIYAAFVSDLREASRGKPFVSAVPITAPPVKFKRPHVKAVALREGEEADAGHKFHEGIARGSAALLKALAA